MTMKLKVMSSFLVKTVLTDDVIGLVPIKAGIYPIKAIDEDQFEVVKSKETICYLTSQRLEEAIKSKTAVIVSE
jgi:hypothetical protein